MPERRVSATELQRNARSVIDEARISGEPVVVESRGKPLIALVPYDKYQRYQETEERSRREFFDRLFAFAEANAATSGLTEEEGNALAAGERRALWEEQQARSRPE